MPLTHAHQPYPESWNDMAVPLPHRATLTVSEVERLAKAGVKIEFDHIKDQVRPDPDKGEILFGQVDEQGLIRDFLRRWDRAQPVTPGHLRHFAHVSACVHGAYVHVFVVLMDGKAAHVIDEAPAYPSEALMAKVFLLQKEGSSG